MLGQGHVVVLLRVSICRLRRARHSDETEDERGDNPAQQWANRVEEPDRKGS